MEFNVKGITFKKDDLETKELLELKVNSISKSHLFHLLPGGKRAMLLLRAGDFIESSFVSKYIDRGMSSCYELNVCSEEDLIEYREMWLELSSAKSQRDQYLVRDKILCKIAKDFINSKEKSFLSFVVSSFEIFYNLDADTIEKFQRISMVLYSRALLTSSISLITLLCNGYVDFSFIKDFYNTTFLMDYGLVEYEDFNYALSLASEAERNDPGSGISILDKYKRSEGEKILFKGHPNISYEYAITLKDNFKNPEILDVIQLHHEKVDGSGFPNGYSYSCLSDTETLLMFCDYYIPFKEHIFKIGDGNLIINGYFDDLMKMENAYMLPINKLKINWAMMMTWAIDQIHVKKDKAS